MTNRPWLYPCFTAREILEMPARGGWFYGLVRTPRGVMLAEIYPGTGYGKPFGTWDPRWWARAIGDVVMGYFR